MTTINTSVGRGFTRITAILLLVAAAVLVAECRTIQEDHPHLKYQQKRSAQNVDDSNQFQADGSTDGEDDGANTNQPVITSDVMVLNVAEGSTVQLPCKVTQGSLDDYTLLWINGTKTIMTDGDPATPNTRVKQDNSQLAKTLFIEGVTRWDSGTYTCRITSEPAVEITHTLKVLRPPKIMSIKVIGAEESTTSGGKVKKFTVKQGEPIQFKCDVDGNPEPKVQWVKRMNHQQMLLNAQSLGIDQNPVSPQQLPTITVSNSNEFKIEYTNAHHDAGHYECIVQNKQGDPLINMEMELVIEYPPIITLRRPVVNTGETYTAQIVCTVSANPKVKVTWEKEQTNEDGSLSFEPLSTDNPNSRYETFRPKDIAVQGSENVTSVQSGHNYGLKVRRVQGPKDFGKYRCKAENKLGHTYSSDIILTGTPASPQQSHVHITKSGFPELEWNVDSWSPLLEYQLQFKRQQDHPASWYEVRPQPEVVNPSSDSSTADERRYAVSYVFGEDNKQTQSLGGSTYVPLSLQRGTTYVARIRAKNQHGWSDWSADVIFSGVDINKDSNEINQNGDGDAVKKASVGGGSSGASRMQQLQYCGFTVLAITLAVVSYC